MKRAISALAIVILVALSLFGCSGKDGAPGAPGPAGKPGSPQTMKVLILGEDTESSVREVATYYIAQEFFAFGSTVNYLACRDSVPTLEALREYDAVLFYANYNVSEPEAKGNVLADYVDRGGKLVICTYAIKSGVGPTGRIISDGYCPFVYQPSSGISTSPFIIDPTGIDFPPLPIFSGVDIDHITYWRNGNYPRPMLDTGATELAKDQLGDPAVAINSSGNIIAVNIYPGTNQLNDIYYYANKLIANCLIYLAGKY